MTREDIIRMAREAGMEQDEDNFFSPNHEKMDVHVSDLERFAELVRADERDACAGLCDRFANRMMSAEECAAAIRSRGQA